MQTQLIKHGNDFALIIKKPLLNQLGIGAEASFEVTTDGKIVVLTPVRGSHDADAFQNALETGSQKYAEALKKLAE